MSGIRARYERVVATARARSGLVDHAFRAAGRYGEVTGGRLAAGVAYYAFFAVFAFGLVAYSVLGYLVDYLPDLRDTVDSFLQESLPVVDADQIAAGRGAAGLFGLLGMVVTGLGWVAALRAGQRLIWGLEQDPGKMLVRRALDAVAVAVLALLMGTSLAVVVGIELLLSEVPVVRQLGWVLTIGVNLVLAAALLMALPRLRLPARQLLPAATGLAVGLFLLNTVGRIYLDRIQANPAYTVVATAAGLLVYLYLFHQLVLAAACWAATSRVPDAAGAAPGGDGEAMDAAEQAVDLA